MKFIVDFPPPDVVAQAWRIGVSSITTMSLGHGAQALVRLDNRHEFVLKRVRRKTLTPDQIEFVLEAVRAAEDKYSINVAAPLATRKNAKFLLEWGDRYFYLVRFINGDRPSFKKTEDVADVFRTLAQLHVKCGGIGRALAAKLQLPTTVSLDEEFESSALAMNEVADGVDNFQGNALAGKLLRGRLKEVRANISRAREVIKIAASEGINFEHPRTLCHGDSHENNYLLQGRAKNAQDEIKPRSCCMLDIESFDSFGGIDDLIVPLHTLGFYNSWSRNVIERALEAYESVRPLSAGERAFLLAHLILPRQWFRATRSLLKRNGNFRHINFWIKWYRHTHSTKNQMRCMDEMINSEKT